MLDEVISSPLPLVEPHAPQVKNLAELLLVPRAGEDPRAPILLGCSADGALDVSLSTLRSAVVELAAAFEARGLSPGDTVCLIRLPRTSETPLAVTYAALSAFGARVLFPMFLELDQLARWLEVSNARAVLFNARELRDLARHDADRAQLDSLEKILARRNVPAICMTDDLHVPSLLAEAGARRVEAPLLDWITRSSADTECLLLTTSGTSGRAKLVRYRQGAFLASCRSWETAGLFAPERFGNRGLCPLLAHSMGLRSFWNAIWTRQALCLITPEWFAEHPERVRALLESMQPRHVAGGPAVYRTLLELVRVFPELGERCLRKLTAAISIGAPFDADLLRRFELASGLAIENGFGTTETMMVATTLIGGPHPPGALGAPLPGVQLRLQHDGEVAGAARLHVSSPFGCAGYLGEETELRLSNDGFIDSGDLVERTAGAALRYLGRREDDFIKDSFGVKVPRALLLERYGALGDPVEHLEHFPLRDEPGLAALVFVRPRDEESVTDTRTLDRVRALLEERLERLRGEIEELELRHLTIARFACVAAEPPRTAKGTTRRSEIERRWSDLIARLTGPYVQEARIALIDRDRLGASSTVRLTSPRRGELLRIARLDKAYRSGYGDRLTYEERGREVTVADFVGGFGGNLLGHRHPAIAEELSKLASDGSVLLFDQGSARPHQGELARRLALLVGRRTGSSYVVRFGSTGAEAVEMALAHAMLELEERIRRFARDQKRRFGSRRPREIGAIIAAADSALRTLAPKVIAIRGSFHGNTLGSRSVLFSSKKRGPFEPMMNLRPIFVAPDGSDDIAALVAGEHFTLEGLTAHGEHIERRTFRFNRIIAAIAEPILGEGGVVEVSPGLLSRLSSYDFPLIIDEIQAGLGRTGTLLASEGARGHYYLFAKALGAGVAKVSALLVERPRYLPRFDELYASTFAGDALSCRIAARALDVIAQDDVPARARDRGAALKRALEEVRSEHPEIVREIRGRGLMLGVELDPNARAVQGTLLLRALAERELLGVLAAAYLLNRHRVRVLPTLSAPNTLRVEPSAYLDDAAIAALAGGLREWCRAVEDRRTVDLVSFLVEEDTALDDAGPGEDLPPLYPVEMAEPAPGAVRVAFLSHFVLPERELAAAEPSLGELSLTARRALFHRLMSILELEPIVASAQNLLGGRVWFLSLLVPADAATLEHLHRRGYRRLETDRIQEAVDLAARHGCEIVALGGFTSILTRDGTTLLPPPGVQITSGNTFTAAVGARRLLRAAAEAGIALDAPDTTVAIVGATGNIGKSLARRLIAGPDRPHTVVLVARAASRAAALRDELQSLPGASGVRIEVASSVAELQRSNLIAIAVNTNEPLISPQHLDRSRPVVIADVSVPSAVSREVRDLPNVRIVALAGTVVVPGEERLMMSTHTPQGTAFCCAAEAMLLGLERNRTRSLELTGEIDPSSMELLDRLGAEHGFLERFGEGRFKAGA